MPDWTTSYLSDLKKRSKESHAYQKHQVFGLEIAETLGDPEHKALYIKLAKIHNPELLLRLAKGVAERSSVRNPGAYFMRLLQELPVVPPSPSPKYSPSLSRGKKSVKATKPHPPRKPKSLKTKD